MIKRSLSPIDQFTTYYRLIYETRWDALYEALIRSSEPIAFCNGLLQPYFLDKASLIGITQLPIAKDDIVLDMCAAPGGKSLVIASQLMGNGQLVCNDRSRSRRARLHKVIEQHLPIAYRSNIKITGHDATTWGLYEQNKFDAILLDAPCSSERHVLHDEKALNQWSPSRTKRLAIQQFAMLAAALEAVKVGGYILYSTCSISPLENEMVIDKLLHRRTYVQEIPLELPQGEKETHGWRLFPDVCEGIGPLFISLLRKTDE